MTITGSTIEDLVARALAEDVGGGDVTTAATVPDDARARATITQKAPGRDLRTRRRARRRSARSIRELVARAAGRRGRVARRRPGAARSRARRRALLTAERTALNFLQRLSGVATLTARCVQAVEGTGARILDTRKTTPGLRALEKAAVAAGGGTNHRAGLYDAILIKENHSALAGGVGAAVRRALRAAPGLPLEVECGTLAEVDEALAAGAQRILLDNMTAEQLREAVRTRRRARRRSRRAAASRWRRSGKSRAPA